MSCARGSACGGWAGCTVMTCWRARTGCGPCSPPNPARMCLPTSWCAVSSGRSWPSWAWTAAPGGGVEDAVAEWVPAGMTVTVTASPARGLDATLDLTERLAARGYRVVPHVSARLVADDAHLDRIVARLLACGVDDVFVPAGDADPPAGPFDNALSLLTRLTEMGRPFARVGITGYPESHPRIKDDITIQAMWDKRHHAAYIVSNLCFDPAV